jgi:serine/threonine protein kinase/tetratricopeptide (TPR) repeat protein
MDQKRWQRLRQAFLAVCDLDAPARARALEVSCADDPGLAAEVEGLLHASEVASHILESAPVAAPADDVEVNSIAQPYTHIGPYRLQRLIASGGMGTVYLAQRDDDQYQKAVAIKLVRRELMDAEVLRRFRVERQALANLDHPNIAHLLDGGIAADGVPYVVMEYVEGEAIDTYCDRRNLSVTRRLRLFVQVCRAVAHAHRNLVLHRDLKPANILVTPEGAPKLLDFGIAKLLRSEDAGETTVTGRLALTPRYASPERIRGEPDTTGTDVYSLGVILYELLCGRRPFYARTTSLSDLERAVLEVDPPPPSVALGRILEPGEPAGQPSHAVSSEEISALRDSTPARLSRRLRGDLDNIVLMAMRKESQRRYSSPAQLADDIENHLANLPVQARPSSRRYRAAKFSRRHWIGISTTALVGLTIVVAVLGIVRQARIAARERDQAIVEQHRAEAVVGLLENMLTSVRPGAQGSDVSMREVLDQAAGKIERRLEAEPLVKASLLRTIGRTYTALGLYEQAEPQLRKALKVFRENLGDEHLEVIESLNDLGNLLGIKGALDEAESTLRQALAISEKRLGPQNPMTIKIKVNLAEQLGEHRDLDEATQLLEAALSARRARLGENHADVAETLDRLSKIALRRGRWAEADRYLTQSLGIYRQMGSRAQPLILQTLVELAGVRKSEGRTDEAMQLYGEAEPVLRKALAIHRKMLGDEHPMTITLMNDVARLLADMGSLDEAESLLREAIQANRARIDRGEPDRDRARNNLATVQYNLAEVLSAKQQFAEVEDLLTAALSTREEILGSDSLSVADTLASLAESRIRNGDLGAGQQLLERALRIRQAQLNPDHPLIAEASARLAELRRMSGKE